jgi:hypothetical protein
VGAAVAAGAPAASTIDGTNHFAYAANAGWVDARGDGAHGSVIGEYICSNYLYCANAGWISLGVGQAANGSYYSNTASNDWGVNHVGDGRLRGFAYGANIGWVNFEGNGNPRFDLLTGKFDGYAYSANVGWISLSNAAAFVQTDSVAPGADTDGDGMPDAWEYLHIGNLTTYGTNTDADGDGSLDREEYGADTNPRDPAERLEVTAIGPRTPAFLREVSWASQPTRFYHVEVSTNLLSGAWVDCGLGLFAPDPVGPTTRAVNDAGLGPRYFRATAVRPLTP